MKQEADRLNEVGREYMRQGYASLVGGRVDEKGLVYFKQAEGYFRKAHDLDPENGHYQLNMADSLFAQGRVDEANVHFEDATKTLKPDSDHLADVRRRWGKYVRSSPGSEILETIGMRDCRDADRLNEMGREYMKQGYAIQKEGEERMGYLRKAEACFARAHELNPANWHSQLNIADSLFAQGRVDEANVQFNEAVEKTGTHSIGAIQSDHLMGVMKRWGGLIHSLKT